VSDWIEVAGEVQKEALREFGIDPSPAALFELRTAANRLKVSLYVVHNRAREGDLRVGSAAPDVLLTGIDGSAKTLRGFESVGRPLVVLAGSYSCEYWCEGKGKKLGESETDKEIGREETRRNARQCRTESSIPHASFSRN